MKNISIILGVTGLLGLSFISCDREYDTPPIATIPEGNIISIQDAKDMVTLTTPSVSFTEDYSIYGVLTTDETSGNFYKEAYFQDATGGINWRFTSSASTHIGDSIRLSLKGALITTYQGNFQIDSLDPDLNVIIQENNVEVEPLVLNILQASTGYARLVQIDNVEFIAGDLGSTWADAANQNSVTLVVTDCNGNLLDVRSSGFANFAGDVIPEGNGSLIGIMGSFNGNPQFIIRNPNELTLNGARCTGGGTVTCDPNTTFNETFGSFFSGNTVSDFCWSTTAFGGAPQWLIGDISGDKLAVASLSGTSSSGAQGSWLISPEFTYSASQILSFSSAVQNYNHDGLEVYILTNYAGDPNTATQTLVTGATIAGSGSANNTLVGSGNVALSGFGISGNYRIAFKYSGNPGAGQTSTYKVDNFIVQ